ncbi:MAG: SulP family inorganic anion transporter [Rhodobiaceae bacterium]|nr:SulP family inorganic anion transporter [Rhodobiaceae bacterium]MCC0014381.1 SulP family inorganic anion transporter [Rhodobiaceae bacterium]MCC0018637.1 SulP family inorganic anion transporter [Rhodobiaceae bacterium]MCC0050985.1 SulP family inorganic anion transporter [Rhodobiaceae bacterium]MCC0060344.1 SulP family inorganic anion transporter [Rhodobiaceae bacterium]
MFGNLRGDIFGGVTAAVVALPLALAFGVASGVGAIAGLYGAIAVGFFAAVLGGTPSQVSGPTGPMTVVMAAIVAQHAGNLPEAFAIVILGGVGQIILGTLRVGRYVSYTPYSVVSGFMSGIGVIIIVIQILPFIGLPTASGGPLGTLQALPSALGNIDIGALVIGGLSLAIMIFWPPRLRAILPPPLAALIAGTLAGLFLFPGVPVIGDVPTGLPEIVWPSIPIDDLPRVISGAATLALLGSIDSLLTSLVADSITGTRHNSNRELIGQGIGNMIAGFIGGLPGAGATMRTVVNVRAGGRTPISGALHSLILLALVLGLGPLAERVPHAVLAGILFKVGYDIIDWGYLRRVRRAPRDKVFVMFATFALTVFVDLITAVAAGIILASFVTARWQEQEQLEGVTRLALPNGDSPLTPAERDDLARAEGAVSVVFLRGSFSYASARELASRVGAKSAGQMAIVYDFTEAARIDTSAALALEELITKAAQEHEACFISGLGGKTRETLEMLGALDGIPSAHQFENRTDAIHAAVEVALTKGKAPE